MQHPGWIVVILGLLMVGVGLLWLLAPAIPLGRLPGDIVIERGNFRFYFPLTSAILLSFLLSGILWLFRLMFR